MSTKKETTDTGKPAWISEEDFKALFEKHPTLDLLEVESIKQPGKKLEVFVCPPDDIAWGMSSRAISNMKEGSNDIMKSQTVMADRCIVKAEPDLQKELDDEATSTPVRVAIGTTIGKLYPIPEARLKKSFKRPG